MCVGVCWEGVQSGESHSMVTGATVDSSECDVCSVDPWNVRLQQAARAEAQQVLKGSLTGRCNKLHG